MRGIDVDVLHARGVHVDLWVRQLLDEGRPGPAPRAGCRRPPPTAAALDNVIAVWRSECGDSCAQDGMPAARARRRTASTVRPGRAGHRSWSPAAAPPL